MKKLGIFALILMISPSAFAGLKCAIITASDPSVAQTSFRAIIDGNGKFQTQVIDKNATVLKLKAKMKVISRDSNFFILENNEGERIEVSFMQELCKSELKKQSTTCYQATAHDLNEEAIDLSGRTRLECVTVKGFDFNFPN